MTEGEKAVDLLRSLGLAATCGYAGASFWAREWPVALWATGCRELVILPDADATGRKHAEAVAAASHAVTCDGEYPMHVKIVPLPGLSDGADVVDWIESGQSIEDLLVVVSGASWWAPGAAERLSRERKRQLNILRQRRFRERRRAERLDVLSSASLRSPEENCGSIGPDAET